LPKKGTVRALREEGIFSIFRCKKGRHDVGERGEKGPFRPVLSVAWKGEEFSHLDAGRKREATLLRNRSEPGKGKLEKGREKAITWPTSATKVQKNLLLHCYRQRKKETSLQDCRYPGLRYKKRGTIVLEKKRFFS